MASVLEPWTSSTISKEENPKLSIAHYCNFLADFLEAFLFFLLPFLGVSESSNVSLCHVAYKHACYETLRMAAQEATFTAVICMTGQKYRLCKLSNENVAFARKYHIFSNS